MGESPKTETSFRRLEPPRPLHRTVQDEIRNHIVSNGLVAGDALQTEAELARQFGVSRNSVREAVKALESTGVLETRRGKGVYVKDFSFTPLLEHLPYGLMAGSRALRELVTLRKALESAMIGDAMAAIRPESVEALRAELAAMDECRLAGRGFKDHDREFHRLLFVDLDNRMLLQLFDLFWQAFDQAGRSLPASDPLEVQQRHAAIYDAVVSGDVTAARDAVQQHYLGIEERLEQ